MKKLSITTSHPYDVITGSGILKQTGEFVRSVFKPCKACIVTDSTVNSIYAQVVTTSLMEKGFQTSKIVFPAGEHSKNMITYVNVLEALANEGLSRSDILIGLGGGTVSDLTGFVASTYMRGIEYVQIPTTLLSAADASIGGKTGINLMNGKNLAGTFWQPSLVVTDYKTLDSLSENKLRDGLAEAVKSAVISDKTLIPHILKKDYPYIIERCLSIKKSLVEADEYDNGVRQLLSFGHTIAHGIEKITSFSISHGAAVAKGMVAEAKAAFKLGLCDSDISKELSEILTELGFDISLNFPVDELSRLALMDKKIQDDKITVIVPEYFGKCTLHKLPLSDLNNLIQAAID